MKHLNKEMKIFSKKAKNLRLEFKRNLKKAEFFAFVWIATATLSPRNDEQANFIILSFR